MEKIIMKGTAEEPNIIFDPQNNHFEISGSSYLFNVSKYKEVIQWLDEYSKSPNPETRLIIKMDYFDVQSSRFLYDIFERLEVINKSGKKAEVLWYYKDAEMKEAGEEYATMVEVPFNEICLN